MTEEPSLKTFTVIIKPIDPPFDGILRFMVCLNQEAEAGIIDFTKCNYPRPIHSAQRYTWGNYINDGNHFISIALWLAETMGDIPLKYRVEIFMSASDGLQSMPLQYVQTFTLEMGEPRTISFTIQDVYPWLTGLPLISKDSYERLKEEERFVITNDPDTLSVTEVWGAVSDHIGNAVNNVAEKLSGLFSIGTALIGYGRDVFFGGMTELFQRSAEESIITTLSSIDNVVSNSPEWKKDIDTKITTYTNSLVKDTLKTLSPEAIGESALSPKSASEKLTIAGLGGLALHTTAFIGGIVAEASTLGQLDGFTRISEEVLNHLGLGDLSRAMVMTPLEPLLLIPAKQFWYSEFTPLIPNYPDLINMAVKEVISVDELKEQGKYQGYSEEWSQRIWDAHYIAPNFGDIRRAYHRGKWDITKITSFMKLVDLDPRYNKDVWLSLLEEIPPANQLINMRVKEVIGSIDFNDGLRFHGYEEKWGKRIWDAHFMPPSLGDIMTAYRRGIPVAIPEIDPESGAPTIRNVESLSLSDVHQLMTLVDLDPRYQDIFDTRLYIDPSPRMGRWLFEGGTIDEERLKELVHRFGYRPEDENLMVEMLRTFQVRRFRNRYVTQLLTAYVSNTIGTEELRSILAEEKFVSEVGDYIVKIGDIRKRISETPQDISKPKILTMSQLDKGFIRDIIDDSQYTARMIDLGYQTIDIELKLRILELDKHVQDEGRRIVTLTVTQILNAWRYEQMSEDEVRMELQLRGLPTIDVERLINTKRIQWKLGTIEAS